MTIQIKGISKSFGKKQIINDISFTANEGQCIGILGENGSGKSTLLSILGGVLDGTGSFQYQEKELLHNHKYHNKTVGFVPQNPPLIYELNARDNLKLWYEKKRMEQEFREGVLHMLGIDEFVDVRVSKMSGGMKKRLSIGCAVANHPKILLLDEPSAALDLVCKENIIAYLNDFKEKGGIVIIASHDMNELSICDHLYVLKNATLTKYEGNRTMQELVGCLKNEK